MNSSPLFSVLIANYNNGKYLQEAIASVYAQTYKNWEIILVDDASTDNSKDVYSELEKDARIHIFYNEKNMGCGYTKRRCAELANGELCGYLDPDDELLPVALDKMVVAFCDIDDVSIVYSRCYICNNKGEIIGENNHLKLSPNETYFDYRWYGAMHFAAYKNVLYKKTEGVSADLAAGVDQDLYFKMEEVGRPYVLNEFTYKYFWRGDGQITASGNVAKTYYWNLEVRRRTCERRNLDVNKIMLNDFSYIIESCARRMVPDLESKRVQAILNSYSYRLGNFILAPFIWLKKKNNKSK